MGSQRGRKTTFRAEELFLSISLQVRTWPKGLLSGLLVLPLLNTLLAAQATVIYDDPAQVRDVTENLMVLVDSSATLSLDEIPDLPVSAFDPEANFMGIGFSEGQIFVRLYLENRSGQDLFLFLENRSVKVIDCLVIAGDGGISRWKGGKYHDAEVKVNGQNAFIFALGPDPSQVVLRVAGPTMLGSPVMIGSAGPIFRWEGTFYFFLAASIWIPLLLGFLSAIVYGISRNILFGLYGLFQLTNILLIGNGWLSFFRTPFFDQLFALIDPSTLNFLAFIAFSLSFLEIKRFFPVWYRWILIFVVLTILPAVYHFVLEVLSFFMGSDHDWFKPLSNLKPPGALVFGMWITLECIIYLLGWLVLLRGYTIARFFILGYTLLLLCGWISMLALGGLIPAFPYLYAFYLGILTDAIFFSFALADRINNTQKEREQAQRALLLQTQKTHEQQNRLFALREELARDLHDEMGSNLSSISLWSEALKRQLPAENRSHLQHIGNKAREMMGSLQDLIWTTNVRHDRLADVLDYLREHAVKILEPQGVQVAFEFPDEPPDYRLSMKTRKEIFLIFKEAINNCAKYAEAKAVTVGGAVLDGQLHLQVTDNGRGFDMEVARAKPGGHGLQNMTARIQALQGELHIQTSPGEGTSINFSFPIT